MDFVGNIARKKGESSLLAIEAVKTQKAREIGEASGLFRVPKVLDFDEQKGVLDFERIDGLATLLQLAVEKDPRLCDLMERAGRALAVVHRQLLLPDDMKHQLPPQWMARPDDNVFIHGDFGGQNVCYCKGSDQLVVLDWSAAPLIGRVPTYGSRYFDILWFVSFMFRGCPNRSVLAWDVEKLMAPFVTGYAQEAAIDADGLAQTIPAMRTLQKRSIRYLAGQKTVVRAAVYSVCQIVMYARLRRFMDNLSTTEKGA
mgnify:CR=1 FL=1